MPKGVHNGNRSRKGIPNKDKQGLKRLLMQKYGSEFNPIMKMAELAWTLHKKLQAQGDEAEVIDIKSGVDAWDKVAQYVEPKLKAMDLSVGEGELVVSVIRKDFSGEAGSNADS